MLSRRVWSERHIAHCLRALGCTDREMEQPFVGVINSYNEAIPGHVGLRQIADAVKAGIRTAGGTPFEGNTIGVCDGMAMNHPGMKYSLASRELIADSVEVVAQGHAFDALVLIPNCDKIIPGMLMAAARHQYPDHRRQRRADAGRPSRRPGGGPGRCLYGRGQRSPGARCPKPSWTSWNERPAPAAAPVPACSRPTR